MLFVALRQLIVPRGRTRRGVRMLAPALLLALVGIVLVGVGTLSAPVQARQAENTPLALFGEMMPVFSSPRCANCHGGVNPVSGANHEPGPVTDSTRLSNGDMGFDEQKVCQECHTAGTANWRIAPSAMGFVGKDTLALCRQIRKTTGLDNATDPDVGAAFVNHLATDDLIGVGFVGQGGIGPDSPFAPIAAEPPPMSRGEMVAAAQTWIDQGHAKCEPNTWSGTITSTTTAQNHQDRQPGTLLMKDSATELKVMLVVADSTATASVTFTQHDFTDAPQGRPCWVIHDSWTADGKGDAGLQIIGDPADGGGVFLAWNVPAYSGTHHSEINTVPPACKATLRDEPYTVRQSNGGVQPTVDPDDTNHLVGQQVVEEPNNNTTTTIKWNLSRNP